MTNKLKKKNNLKNFCKRKLLIFIIDTAHRFSAKWLLFWEVTWLEQTKRSPKKGEIAKNKKAIHILADSASFN